ncbi:hypothetical protein ACU4GH_06100 [Bradyrhizobium betae]
MLPIIQRTALQQEDEHGAQHSGAKASPYKRHKVAARGLLYAAVPDGLVPGNARMLRASDNFWK